MRRNVSSSLNERYIFLNALYVSYNGSSQTPFGSKEVMFSEDASKKELISEKKKKFRKV